MRRNVPLLAAIGVAIVLLALALARNGSDAQTSDPVVAAPHGGAPAAFAGPDGRVALDGPWVVRGDRFDRGRDLRWHRGRFRGRAVRLPHVPNANRILGEEGIDSHEGSIAWYRTAFEVPRGGDFALRFESVNHRAAVWIDGRRMATHVGEYLPFEARVRLAPGRHRLVVRADFRGPMAMKRQGWHRTWFNFGGINREVTIRRLGPSELRHVAVQTRLDRGRDAAVVRVGVHVTNTGRRRVVPLRGSLVRGDQVLPVRFPRMVVPRGETRVAAGRVEVPDPALWAPGAPNLYELRLEVPGESGYRVRTGLRVLERRGRKLLLNGVPLRLKGASIHEDAPGSGDGLHPRQMDGIVERLRAIGANATRSQHPLNPALVERLDAAGILLWQGIGPVDAPGAWTNKTAQQRRSANERARDNVRQLQPHPSIIAWNLVNEVAGNGHPDGQIPYVRGTARWLHERDPGRLVVLDLWGKHPPRFAGPIWDDIDAVAWTNYIGWYEIPFSTTSQLRLRIRTELDQLRRLFPGKAIVVSEFGAEGNDRNAPDRPGGFSFQQRFLRTHIDTYLQDPSVSGFLVWNLSDFAVAPSFAGGSIKGIVAGIDVRRGLNEKGLFTYAGDPKPSVQTVRGFFAGLGPYGF